MNSHFSDTPDGVELPALPMQVQAVPKDEMILYSCAHKVGLYRFVMTFFLLKHHAGPDIIGPPPP